MAKRRRRASRWASEAAMETLVRYGPELSGLKELQRQAQSDLGVATQQARGGRLGTESAIDLAAPSVAHVYDEAGLDQARTASILAPDIAALGPVANSIKAGALLEQAEGGRHIAEARAASLADLATRKVQAAEGENFAVTNARRQFTTDMAKILGRKQDLRREMGAFSAATIGNLTQEQRERALKVQIERMGNRTTLRSARASQRGQNRRTRLQQREQNRRARISAKTSRENAAASRSQSERNSLRTAGIDPDTGRPIPGGKADPKVIAAKQGKESGKGPASFTPSQKHATNQEIGGALQTLGDLKVPKGQFPNRTKHVQAAKQILLNGLKDAQGNTIRKAATNDPVLATAAAERYVFGWVNPGTYRRVRRNYGVALKRKPGGNAPPRNPRPRATRPERRRGAVNIPGFGSTVR